MKDSMARCGNRCNLCQAYKGNIHSKEDKQKISDGWFKFYGFRIPAEKIFCDGCLTDDSFKPNRIGQNCPVCSCVTRKRLQNCGHCEQYICETLKKRIVDYKQIALELQKPILKEDYRNFIMPYEGEKVQDVIRKDLKKELNI